MGMMTPTKIKFDRKDVSFGKGPPSGLVPVGDSGLYVTPDEPADVTDCNRYPDSIYCGGNPFSVTPVGLDANIEVDPCGVTASVTPIIGFVKAPPVHVSYRLPGECRNEYEKPRDNKQPKFDAPEPESYGCADLGLFDVDDEKVVYAFVSKHYAAIDSPNLICDNGVIIPELEQKDTAHTFTCPGIPVKIAGTMRSTEVYCVSERHEEARNLSAYYDSDRQCNEQVIPNRVTDSTDNVYFTLDDRIDYYITADGQTAYYEIPRNTPSRYSVNETLPKPWYKIQSNSIETGGYCSIYKGKWKLLKAYLAIPADIRKSAGYNGFKYPIFNQPTCLAVIEEGCKVVQPTFKFQLPPPPPPPPPKKECCMSCCSPSQQQDQQDYMPILKQILKEAQTINKSVGTFPVNATIFDENENEQEAQGTSIQIGSVAQSVSRTIERVEKISKIIGIDALPLTVPDSICDPINDGILENIWDAITPDATRRINNLFEWNVWMLEQFSAVMGHWQMEIQIEAEKPQATEGEEQPPTPAPKKIVMPDVRSTLKELLMLNIQQYKALGLVLDVVLKGLTETSSAKKEIVAAQLNIQEMVDFLDYQTDQDSVNVPMQISVPGTDLSEEDQNDLHKYLQPTEIPVRYEKWNGRKSLTDLFIHLATLLSRT